MQGNCKAMVCLVGEQPIPNLIPVRHFKPEIALLVHSTETVGVANNLKKVLEEKNKIYAQTSQLIPFEIHDSSKLRTELEKKADFSLGKDEVLFNVTGGTKAMSISCFMLAQEYSAPLVYLQSERGESVLFIYSFISNKPFFENKEIVQETIDLDDYLKIHIGKYSYRKRKKNDKDAEFEELIFKNIDGNEGDLEVKKNINIANNVEVDLLIRSHNQVGIAEVTTGKPGKNKIDQLNSACSRERLGIYTKKFLITLQEIDENNISLAKAYNINVIKLLQSAKDKLSEEDREQLRNTIKSKLGAI